MEWIDKETKDGSIGKEKAALLSNICNLHQFVDGSDNNSSALTSRAAFASSAPSAQSPANKPLIPAVSKEGEQDPPL
jgi:hypothetical protein